MKRILSLSTLFCFIVVGLFAQDAVVMKINGEDIALSEFKYIWNKNNSNQSVDSSSLDEYVDMFVNFKLKVAAGKEAGLDTLDSFKKELAGYRAQLTPEYLKDEATEIALQEEAYAMIQTYLELSHILLPVQDNQEEVYQQALTLRQQIMEGKPFEEVAKEFSTDSSRDKGGYLGSTLASRYIYPFAKAAMQMQKDEISMPVRTQFGYHLIKMHQKIQVPGEYLSGHILKAAPASAPEADKAKAEAEIRDIYRELQAGKSFEELANGYRNDDRYVVGKNGQYPLLRGGALPIEYENAVFALKDGEYSEPFQTSYGWHIVKRYQVSDFPAMEEVAQEIEQMLQRDERKDLPFRAFSEKLKKVYHYQEDAHALQLLKITLGERSAMDESTLRVLDKFPVVATFDNNELTAKKFIAFLNTHPQWNNQLDQAWTEFVHSSLVAYEDSQLESKYPDFGHLMQEYHDGMLLFEVSNQMIWNKAATDSVGLAKFYKKNKQLFRWEEPRFKGTMVGCTPDAPVKEIEKLAKKLPADSIEIVLKRRYNTDSTSMVRIDRGVWKKGGSNPMVNKVVFGVGNWEPSGHFSQYFPVGEIMKQPKSLNDVRGVATAKYQDYLEAQWIADLRKQYEVIIYPEVLNQLR